MRDREYLSGLEFLFLAWGGLCCWVCWRWVYELCVMKVDIVGYAFTDSDIVKPPQSSKLNLWFFLFGFSHKFLCSSVLLDYINFSALIILFICFKCHQEQDSYGDVFIISVNKVVSELRWGIRDGWIEDAWLHTFIALFFITFHIYHVINLLNSLS